MEQIEQLKAMRDAARARIEALPDFRLMTSLSALIDDLEKAIGIAEPSADAVEASPMESGDAAAMPAETGVAASAVVVSAATVLVETMSEPTTAEAEPPVAPDVPLVDPASVLPEFEPAPSPSPSPSRNWFPRHRLLLLPKLSPIWKACHPRRRYRFSKQSRRR